MNSVNADIEIFRNMSPDQRCQTAFSLYRAARRIKAAALRARHPEWNDEQLQDEVRKVFLHARS